MTHEETIKRIQKLVPSVMALEFGCEFLRHKKVYRYVNACGRDMYRALSADNMLDESPNIFMEEILGKPITLAVVLLAIDTKYTEWENPGTPVAINSKGEFQVWSENPVYKNVFWNLAKDNFNDQSEETKTFIGELLTT